MPGFHEPELRTRQGAGELAALFWWTGTAAHNDDGTAAADGEARQWTVVPPVHTAIGILEQLTATSQLFPLRPHWLHGAPRPPRRRPEPSPAAAGADGTAPAR